MVSGHTARVVLGVTVAVGFICRYIIGERWGHAPVIVLCWVAWRLHLPRERRTVKSFIRFTSLVVAQLLWAVGVGWVLDSLIKAIFGYWPIPLQFLAPFAVPVLHIFAPGSGALLFHVMLDVPFMFMLAVYHFWYGEKLNSLFTQITDHLLLGSLPFASDVATLKAAGVTHVINMCREWRGPVTQYADAGIQQLRLPTTDGMPPSCDDMLQGVEWIRQALRRNPNAVIFIHCRFGMGRSCSMAVVAMTALGWEPRAAIRKCKDVRPEVSTAVIRYPGVRNAVNALAKQREMAKRGVVQD